MEMYNGPDHKEWAQKKPFKKLVLTHLNNLPEADWLALRDHSRTGPMMLAAPNKNLTRSEVVDASLACAGLSVEDVLGTSFNCQIIGHINDQPCFYANGAGYYFWGYPDGGFILEASVTYPAYPIGW